jgi:beta-N-acetylhexosaminidase
VTLAEVGINVDCLPVLDLLRPDTDPVIGDRALGDEPMQVAALGRAILDGLESGGVCGVVKHMPGHGRAGADSHVELPVVDAGEEALAADLAPFRTLHDAAMGMVAHVLYPVWDSERCASLSPAIVEEVIRGGIGFEGLLMSDDIGMAALSGPLPARAQAVLAAGCDLVLHGSGRIEESEAVASALGPLSEASRSRLDRAMARIAGKASTRGYRALAAKRDSLLAYA